MRVLVTGATGLLGHAVTTALAGRGHTVVTLVLASTGTVYGTPTRQPITEDEPPAPNNPYAATKLAADMAAAHTAGTGAIGAVSLRAFNIAGASGGRTDLDTSRPIPKTLAVHAGKADRLVTNGDGNAVRDFVHAEDIADAFARALDACAPGEWRAYNNGSGRRTTVREILDVAAGVTGQSVPYAVLPQRTNHRSWSQNHRGQSPNLDGER